MIFCLSPFGKALAKITSGFCLYLQTRFYLYTDLFPGHGLYDSFGTHAFTVYQDHLVSNLLAARRYCVAGFMLVECYSDTSLFHIFTEVAIHEFFK